MKNAFSLFEIIVVVIIISLISSMGVYKLFFTLDESKNLQVKTQIHLIKNAIVRKQNESILLGEKNIISSLDDALANSSGELLFEKVLHQPLIAASEFDKKIAQWIKLSNSQYKVYVNSIEYLTFTYDSSKSTFECDYSLDLCKEMYQ